MKLCAMEDREDISRSLVKEMDDKDIKLSIRRTELIVSPGNRLG